jgi:mono/diheme cytochrome c family protein/thiol-disulfide isomerase/thioredoxin
VNGTVARWEQITDKDYSVVVFLGTECPLAKLYLPRLAEITEQYGDIAQIVGIDSNTQDTLDEIRTYALENQIPFQILKDPAGEFATALHAERTPEAFILDQTGAILYRGRIDDQYGVGYARENAEQQFLKQALEELRGGQSISIPQTTPIGCFIGRAHKASEHTGVTYHNTVSTIMKKHCVECHQDGEIAPFSLTHYDDVSAWADTVGEVIEQGRMPPWHASPEYGSFANARRMTEKEKRNIARWIAEGCPRGEQNPAPTVSPVINNPTIHRDQSFDQIIPMRSDPFSVPAEGTVEYQYFVIDPEFHEDRWVSSAEVLPGNREVVHHAIVFISAPDQDSLNNSGWLAAYVPGQRVAPLAEGQARKIPAGSRLVFQMHYTPNGALTSDKTKVGLVFTEEENVQEEVITLITANRHFKIPPGAPNHQVVSRLTEFPPQAQLTALVPHMHLRGKSFRIIYQDNLGEEEILLDVPQYDFNWQHVYRLNQPIPLDEAQQIRCIAHFNNSEGNIVNPDPTDTVCWGDQSWEEMMIAFFEVTIPRQGELTQNEDPSLSQKVQARAEHWMSQRDSNGDLKIQPTEVSDSVRRFAFARLDRNADSVIDLEETKLHIAEILAEKERKDELQKTLDQLK